VNEREALARVRAVFDTISDPKNLLTPNGDDGAVVDFAGQKVVLATDMAVEDVHFNLNWSSPRQIGAKIVAANLADICAMGGWPEYLLVAVSFPKSFLSNDVSDDASNLEELAIGIRDEAKKVGAKVIGGDLSSGEKVVISISAVGVAENIISRSMAHPGEFVLISHLPGWSMAGLSSLQNNANQSELVKRAITQHKTPALDYQKYREIFADISAATDISDGLLIDAQNIASSSNCALHLDVGAIKRVTGYEELAMLADELSLNNSEGNAQSAMDWVLRGGEDHVLLATSPIQLPNFHVIGRVESGSGVFLDGVLEGDSDTGFQHQW
jgi:thiamine-monophosphate kinase